MSPMCLLGMFNVATGMAEGAEDPGHLFQKKHYVMTILSVLGLLQMKRCDGDDGEASPVPSLSLMVLTAVLGFLFLLVWTCVRMGWYGSRNLADGNEPDAEPASSDEPAVVEAATHAVEESLFGPVEPRVETTVEGYLNWLIERCCRRRDNTNTRERCLLYEERVRILYGLKSAVEGPYENLRAAVLRTCGQMSGISDDEESPDFERIHASMQIMPPLTKQWLHTTSFRHCSLDHRQA